MQCLSFCLFGVYGVDDQKRIQVQNQDNCKTNCPACSRVCPEAAIMFPKYKAGPINGDLVTIHNIRNFDYRTETDFTPRYYTKTFDLREVDSVDVIASYWMGDAIAHIFLSFGFSGKDFIAISIETRRQRHQSYSTVAGFFKQYELFYVVADERDLIRLRTNYRKDPPEDVYIYRTRAPAP